jgi:predicted RNA-binding protein with PUA-like domain
MSYWLLKSEPDSFGIDDLARAPRRTTSWNGVRNFQARNMLRDEMKKGDEAFFYHSSCEVPGIAGIVKVVKAGYPDPTAFERGHLYFDPDSDRKKPRWYTIDVRLERAFQRVVTLDELRAYAAGPLQDMILLRRGNRLSVTPITKAEWRFVLGLAS